MVRTKSDKLKMMVLPFQEALRMVSVCCIRAGEEVFNTYGQMANWQLLHMYGFIEPYPSNTNDTADIQMTSVYKAALQGELTGHVWT